jgi:hypothetical protein
VAATVLAALVAAPLVHRVLGARIMVTDAARGHEFADNRPMAAALNRIPLDGSVVATNDLRYPGQAGKRDLRQYQIPAIWGHQAFGAIGYERYPGWRERAQLQEALAAPNVSCATLKALAAQGVTHLLLHKGVAYPRTLSLLLLYEDTRYAVYEIAADALSC